MFPLKVLLNNTEFITLLKEKAVCELPAVTFQSDLKELLNDLLYLKEKGLKTVLAGTINDIESAKELGFEFYTNKVLKQKVAEVEIDDDVEKTEKPTFDKFVKAVGLSDEIADICREVIRLKVEE